ncbi:MAG: hypothetical protein II179_03610 [Alphaproteobacteria bacterium]|nr:hypothetical protein [Alphaproteobacteria bacterium]
MATTVQNFIKLANFYNQMAKTMSAICVSKGGIPMEKYVGRFFAADVLEFVVEYGERLLKSKKDVAPDVVSVIDMFKKQLAGVKEWVTSSQKPIYEMSLEEFERAMNI